METSGLKLGQIVRTLEAIPMVERVTVTGGKAVLEIPAGSTGVVVGIADADFEGAEVRFLYRVKDRASAFSTCQVVKPSQLSPVNQVKQLSVVIVQETFYTAP